MGNSPYSAIGIGDLLTPANVQNLGAGGLSVATYNREFIQLSNPAASVNKKGLYNDSLVKIEGAGTAQYKILSAPNALETYKGANYRYFAFTVPIGKVWNTTISMQPFSVKDHSTVQLAPAYQDGNGQIVQYTTDGKGGLYQIGLNNGWGVSKYLSLGLGLSYLFGPANVTETAVLYTNPYTPIQPDVEHGYRRRINHHDFGFKPSMHYRKELYKWKDSVLIPSGVFWNMGATLQIFSQMQMSVSQIDVRKSNTGTVSEDSVTTSYTRHANLPAQLTVGFSLDRPNKWMLGIEGGIADWSRFNYGDFSNDTYRIAWNVAVGGEYRPASRKQWKSPTYRAGINFTRLPYVISGNQLNDFSASLGLTLPVGVRGTSGAAFPKINFAVVVGQRGTLSTTDIQEFYARLHVSILITDKWFIKRRIQ
ncbi:MAG TPA: hypothetical protein VK750_05280 [Cytophagaceae bacterium]|nr:hypothetical protein [Cytophagaceae bacterium]